MNAGIAASSTMMNMGKLDLGFGGPEDSGNDTLMSPIGLADVSPASSASNATLCLKRRRKGAMATILCLPSTQILGSVDALLREARGFVASAALGRSRHWWGS